MVVGNKAKEAEADAGPVGSQSTSELKERLIK